MAPFRVVLDANVLFPFTLRDTLLRAASADLYQVCWSGRILREVHRNLVRTGTTTEVQADRLVSAMAAAFPEAEITGFEHLIEAMPNDEKDRHVAAAAVHGRAQLIVTANLRDFRSLPQGIEAVGPDDFLCDLFDLQPEGLVDLVHDQARALTRPPRTFAEVVSGLSHSAPRFAALVGPRR